MKKDVVDQIKELLYTATSSPFNDWSMISLCPTDTEEEKLLLTNLLIIVRDRNMRSNSIKIDNSCLYLAPIQIKGY
jgi:hypothetical protein